jgi:ABC-type transport system substrate-binding protein
VIGLTQEPASLFGLVEDAFVAHVTLQLLGADGKQYTTLNYDYQANHTKQLPTLENGFATNDDVEVKEGDKVVDANGDVVTLASGMKVINAAGETVDFTGGTVMMKQMTTKFEFLDNLAWPDGEPLKAADIELGWAIKCDPESGATSFITCDKTASFTVEGVTATRVALPGVQDPEYYALGDWYIYPSHRVLADGRTLADVPASEYATLPEIAEQPWGFGPYMITEWVKGEKLVLAAHPYWYGGTPATPNCVVSIVTPENAEAQLLGGQVDVLGSETLTGLTETLVAAEAEGKVINISNPGATWEHIDFNLFLK